MQESKQYAVTAKTPKSAFGFWSNAKWLEDHELPWLVEKYVHRYGFQFENFGELAVVNLHDIADSNDAMVFFHHPVSLNNRHSSILVDHQPQHMLMQLWRSCALINNQNPQLPSRFKVCFLTNWVNNTMAFEAKILLESLIGSEKNTVEKPAKGVANRDNSLYVTGQHWINVIFEFSGLNAGVVDLLNSMARGDNNEIVPPSDEQREEFFKKLPIHAVYDQLHITILDSSSHKNKPALWVAKQICQGFSEVNIQQVSVPIQENSYTCADHAARNGVHFSLFGHAPSHREDIRNNYLEWQKQEEDASVSLALLKGYNYRLTYLQPDDHQVFAMAQQEILKVIDCYSVHLNQQAQNNSRFNPLKSRRLEKLAALSEIKALVEKRQPLLGQIEDIKLRHPKMFDSSAGDLGFMAELVKIIKTLQRLILTPSASSDEETMLEFGEPGRTVARPHIETPTNVIEL